MEFCRLDRVTVGADPEVFFVDSNNKPVSAIGLLGGSKQYPKQIENLPEGYCIQEDNVLAEFNIPPQQTAVSFSAAVNRALTHIKSLAKVHKLKVAINSSMHFDAEQLLHPKALELGCDPDYDAWTGEQNPRPEAPPSLRTAAGHIHVGFPNPTQERVRLLVKVLDIFIGVPLVLLTEPSERKSLYGKAGACRPKPYGLEYRTPDNYWISHKILRCWMFQQVKYAISRLNMDNTGDFRYEVEDMAPFIVNTINTHDKNYADWLINNFGVILPDFPNGKHRIR